MRLPAKPFLPLLAGAFILLWLAISADWRVESPERAKTVAAKMSVDSFLVALESYRKDVGEFPSAEEGLQVLRINPGHKGWLGAYVDRSNPLDPWGHVYEYVRLPDGNVEVRSVGPEHKTLAAGTRE